HVPVDHGGQLGGTGEVGRAGLIPTEPHTHRPRRHRVTIRGEDQAQRAAGAGVAEQAERTDPQIEARHPSTSGRSVATAVSTDRTPASSDAEAPTGQSTSVSTAAVPIVATAVCATVRTARTSAARQKAFENREKRSGIGTSIQVMNMGEHWVAEPGLM